MGTIDKEVLKLEEKLCQCELQKMQLLTEKHRWIVKMKLVMLEKEAVEVKLRDFKEATMTERLEFEKKIKTLTEVVETKKKYVQGIRTANNEGLAHHKKNSLRFSEMADKLLEKKSSSLKVERERVKKLHSNILEKRNNLLSFLKTSVRNSEMSDDVKSMLQFHYQAYVNTLKTKRDDCEILRKYVRSILNPSPRRDFKCPVFASISKFFNFFSTKDSGGSSVCNADSTSKDVEHKYPARGREDDEYVHPEKALLRRKTDNAEH